MRVLKRFFSKVLSGGLSRRFVRVHLLGVALALFAFFVSVFLFFPTDALRARLEQEATSRTGARVEIGSFSLIFPLGVSAKQITVTPPPRKGVPLSVAELLLVPSWGSLLGGEPALSVEGKLLGGRVDGLIATDGGVQAEFASLDVSRALPADLPYSAAGIVGGRISSEGPPLANRSNLEVELTMEQGRITGLEPLGVSGGEISLGRLNLQGTATGRRFKLDEFTARGGDVEASASGTISVGNTPQQSRLAIQLNVRPTASLDAGVRDLFSLTGSKPAADGSYRLRISGSLAKPVLR